MVLKRYICVFLVLWEFRKLDAIRKAPIARKIK
jgi:hypothetical protein